MPRPRKKRSVCSLPASSIFGPYLDKENEAVPEGPRIVMTVEEYETIRLIDLEGLNQEECASQMDVARTTVQRIYTDARKKMAACLVKGFLLKIEGGDYALCSESQPRPGCSRCRRSKQEREAQGRHRLKNMAASR